MNALATASEYMNLSTKKNLNECFLCFTGCILVTLIIGKLTGFTKDAQGLFITINIHHLRSYLKRIASVSLHERNVHLLTIEICKVSDRYLLTRTKFVEITNEHLYNLRQNS